MTWFYLYSGADLLLEMSTFSGKNKTFVYYDKTASSNLTVAV